MFHSSETLDDLLRAVFRHVIDQGRAESGSRDRGRFIEVIGAVLELTDPRARLSRSETKGRPFSALGEFCWYLSGSDRLDAIEPYIRDYAKDAESDGRLHGAYGPRLLNMRGQNQIKNVLALLADRPPTKRAVIQLYSAEDIASDFKEIPCTTSVQFFVREGKLECCVTMRSNDAFKGLPHDVFCFTMLQEIVARQLGLDLGPYRHLVTSLHIYEKQINAAERFLAEGYQSIIPMPPMPSGSQWPHLSKVLAAEAQLRRGEPILSLTELPDYWMDMVRLLTAFHMRGDLPAIDSIISELSDLRYRTYLQRWRTIKKRESHSAS